MGLFKLALQSLKSDLLKTIFYFLSFLLTTVFIFLFFNLAMNPAAGINLGGRDKTIVTPIAVFVILIAMICVFMANDFYVLAKSKDISIVLMSGASVYKVGMYLLLQSLIVMFFAILLGLLLGYLLVPVLNRIFFITFNYSGDFYYVSDRAYVATTIILLFEVGWCTYLNMGYCYRTSINKLINDSVKIETFGFKLRKPSNLFYILAFIVPLIIFPWLKSVEDYLLLSIVAMIGLYGVIKHIIPELIERFQEKYGIENQYLLIVFGNVKYDLQRVRMLVLLVMMSALVLMCSILYTLNTPLISTIVLFSYLSVMILLALTSLFKLGMELKGRKKSFANLYYLGYSLKDLKKIINLEMIIFYGMIILIPLVYQIVIIIRLYSLGLINFYLIALMLIISIIPMLFCMVTCIIMYHHILPKSII